ncbi:MAG: nucleoside recognition protein [Alphaproteobacteria bacterium]|nr:nucleoside recognition protein [Alphaproteobacteria bacterium]
MMNYIWLFFIVCSVIVGLCNGKMADVSAAVMNASSDAVKISLGLIGIMTLWLGLMHIAQKAGLLNLIAKIFSPILRFLFPSVPKDDPVQADIAMNVTANALGLGNAATPMGIKAMEGLQRLNKNEKDTASDDMCTFLTINTAGVQLLPISVIAILMSLGSTNATDIILPTILSTFGALVIGIICVKLLIKISPEGKKGGRKDV